MPSNIYHRARGFSIRDNDRVEGTDVVLFLLEPIEGLFRAVRTVPRRRLHLAICGVCSTAASDLGCSQSDIRGATSDIAPETVHVV